MAGRIPLNDGRRNPGMAPDHDRYSLAYDTRLGTYVQVEYLLQ